MLSINVLSKATQHVHCNTTDCSCIKKAVDWDHASQTPYSSQSSTTSRPVQDADPGSIGVNRPVCVTAGVGCLSEDPPTPPPPPPPLSWRCIRTRLVSAQFIFRAAGLRQRKWSGCGRVGPEGPGGEEAGPDTGTNRDRIESEEKAEKVHRRRGDVAVVAGRDRHFQLSSAASERKQTFTRQEKRVRRQQQPRTHGPLRPRQPLVWRLLGFKAAGRCCRMNRVHTRLSRTHVRAPPKTHKLWKHNEL